MASSMRLNMMDRRQRTLALLVVSVAFISRACSAQTPAGAPQADSSKIAEDGTAYITRIVPVPGTVSPEAQKLLARPASDAAGPPRTVQQDREGTDRWQNG